MGDADPPEDPGTLAASVVETARSHAHDRYLAALLAPAKAQGDLVTLAAYLGEVARIPLTVREAAIGEIRLQWWRDALTSGGTTGHPVADAVQEMAARRSLPRDVLLAPVEGVSRQFYEDGIRDDGELRDFAEETDGSALRLALAVLGNDSAPTELAKIGTAARALALTRLALTLPQHLAHGRLPLPPRYAGADDPRDAAPGAARASARVLTERLALESTAALAAFRADAARIEAAALPAFLPLALVAPYLAAAVAPGRDVLTDVADISPLSRVVRLWFAHWRGRV